MAAVLGALQLDDDQICVAINRQQINPPLAVIPLGEFFRNHKGFRGDHVDLSLQQSLEVGAFAYFLVRESGLVENFELTIRKFVNSYKNILPTVELERAATREIALR